MNNAIKYVRKQLGNYLTFYHELRIPSNDFFNIENNRRKKENILVISSPSRMGNHILMSALDNHPMLPRTPGEDGFLFFSFFAANYDINKFIHSLTTNDIDYLLKLSSNGKLDKWKSFKKLYETGKFSSNYSGVNIKDTPSIQDFSKLTFDINYKNFVNRLKENILNIEGKYNYNKYLLAYLNSFNLLDYKKTNTNYDGYIVFSGMRTQLHWLCRTFDNLKALVSLRPFDTYVYSHIRSKYGIKQELTDELINEAWEYWHHKVIDFIWLKINYPLKIGIVTFDDLIDNSKQTHCSICNFLNIEYSQEMEFATVFGFPASGNSSNINNDNIPGTFYNSKTILNQEKIPKDYYIIWDSVNKIKL